MAFDRELADRVQIIVAQHAAIDERRMFGGIGFMINGNLACGVLENYLIVRVGPDLYEQMLAMPHTHRFDFTGKPMTGWLTVSADGLNTEAELNTWIHRGIEFAQSLPPK